VATEKPFGRWSGVGLVIANMVGAGVFLSTGFMAQSMPPGRILLAWLVGGVMALAGARTYAEVARLVPRGGGEYRYLSSLLHPSAGYLAGWASLLLGFSAPVAVDALAAGAFARVVIPGINPQLVAAGLILVLTGAHAAGLDVSARVQNGLVAVKVLLLVGFVLVCVGAGTLAFPSWPTQEKNDFDAMGFAFNLLFISFAYSGWNAAIYAADEFEKPEKNVPFAMLVGCGIVTALYLVVNYAFIANLTPEQSGVVFKYDEFTNLQGSWDAVTLGQAIVAHLLGPAAGRVMSGVMVLLFTSAISAMTLVGPRVYASMANDGFLPSVLGSKSGKPPLFSVLLQSALALVLVYASSDLRGVLGTVGALLVVFAALTAFGLLVAWFRAKTAEARPTPRALAAAGVYVVSAALLLYFAAKRVADIKVTMTWPIVAGLVALAAVIVTLYAVRKQPGGTS
jgi:APA family basic amino acid/polyamine antiporter